MGKSAAGQERFSGRVARLWLRAALALAITAPVGQAMATSVPFSFSEVAWWGAWQATVPFPQETPLDDPRGYLLEISGMLSTRVSYYCSPPPQGCPPSGAYTVFADISVSSPAFPAIEPVRVLGYGNAYGGGEQLSPFLARFALSPSQAAYFVGSGSANVQVDAILGRTADSLNTRDIYYQQSLAGTQMTLSEAPVPAAGLLMMSALLPLGFLSRNRRRLSRTS